MLTPLLPLIIERLDLQLAMAGFLGTILSMCNLTQPFMGIWGDRMRRRNLILGGALLAAIFVPLLGLASNYLTLAVFLALGGLGVAAFHPQAFSLAGDLSADRRAFGIALFTFGGTLGIVFSPLWIPLFVGYFGIRSLYFLSLPGVCAVLIVSLYVPLDNSSTARVSFHSLLQSIRRSASPLSLIAIVVVLRTITFIGFGFYITQLANDRGLSLVEGGMILAIYNFAGVSGSLLAGYLANRRNSKPIVWISIFMASPTLFAYLQTEGLVSYFWLTLGGLGIMASNSILVALAQEVAPENAAFASSIPLGFSWGLAALSLPLIGFFADRFGLANALQFLALLPILAAFFALFLPARR